MRAVTFSTPEIQDAVQNNFVALTSNIVGTELSGSSVVHSPSDQPGSCVRGNGKQNVQTIFLTPDLRVFHVVTGFISPEELVQEISFAMAVKQQMDDSPDDSPKIVRTMHRDRLEQRDTMTSAVEDQISEMSKGMGMLGQLGSNFNSDNRFLVRYPLIDAEQLDADPGDLVGRGKTFFSSGSSGSSNSGSRR